MNNSISFPYRAAGRFPWFVQASLAVSFLVPILSYADKLQSHNSPPTNIGVILPLTGPFARYGDTIKKNLLASQSTSVRYLFEDEACDPKKAVDAYKKLSSVNNTRIFLGPLCGSPQSAIAPLLKRDKAFALVASSAPESVYALSQGRMFSTQASIEAESRFIAQKMNEKNIQSVVILFSENSFSRAHEAAFREKFRGKVLETLAYTSEDREHLKMLALRIKKLAPEALYIPDAYPLMSGLLRQLRLAGVPKIPVYSVYSIQSDDVLEVVQADGEGLLYSYYDIGEADALDFYPTRAGTLLNQAVKICGNDAECVREQMPKLADFDAKGTLASDLVMKTIREGRFVKVEEN